MKKKVALILLLIVLVIIFIFRFWIVKSTYCSSLGYPECPKDIVSTLNGLKGKSIVRIWSPLRQVFLQDPRIKSYSITTSVFGQIWVFVELRKPDVALKPQGSQVYSLYTKNGIWAGETKETSLPIVLLKEQIDNKDIAFVASFGYEISRMLSVKSISLQGSLIEVLLTDNKILKYPLSGDIDVLLGSTLLTFSQLNEGQGKLMINSVPNSTLEIDFRFKNPILRNVIH